MSNPVFATRKLCALIGALLLVTFVADHAPAQESYEIRIAGYSFDPTVEQTPVSGPLGLSQQERTAYRESAGHYLVQLARPLDPALSGRLRERYGLRLEEYVPELAYLERLEPGTLQRLSEDEAVRAVVPFEPAFKISPNIGELEFRSEERRALAAEGLLLLATLFDSADPEAVREALAEAGATRIELADMREHGGAARIQFLLPSEGAIRAVARIEGVRWIEQVPEYDEDNSNTAGTMQSGTPGNTPVWDVGIHGEGQTIAVMEGRSADIDHCMFRDPATGTAGPGHRKVQATFPNTGGHATFVSGIAVGDDFNNPGTGVNRGNAWAARLVNTRAGSALNMLAQLVSSANDGAFIHTNSWHANLGSPTPYDQIAADVDTFVWRNEEHVVLGSMGNNGEEQGPPGTAKNAIGINAGTTFPNIMNVGDGNPGPTAGGRRKPDLVTPGCNIRSARAGTACTINQWGTCATSWATPAAAAAAALIRQYYADGYYPGGAASPPNAFAPSGALVKATLLNGTIDMTGIAGYPSNLEGWGLARLDDALFFDSDDHLLQAWDTRNAQGLTTGGSRLHLVDVEDSGRPLRVTLVWSDAPGAAGASVPAVNDLNLRVTAPGGAQTYLGNVFAGGSSVTGGSADNVNNVEQVVVNAPTVGQWRVAVEAARVNVGNPGQGYALVATGGRGKEPAKPVLKYAAKLVCGLQENPEDMRLAQGFYATAINIHNPHPREVTFEKALSLTYPPAAQRAGKVYGISEDTLKEDEALEVDCDDIRRRLFPQGFPRPYIKGFVTLKTKDSLNVTGVYSTRALEQRVCCDGGRGRGEGKDCRKGRPEKGDCGASCCVTVPGGHSSIDVEQIAATKVKDAPREEACKPDLVPVPTNRNFPPPWGFCTVRDGELLVRVRNQSQCEAAPSVTEVFYPGSGQTRQAATPQIPAGGSADVLVEYGGELCSPEVQENCFFDIRADGPAAVPETNEANNLAQGICFVPL